MSDFGPRIFSELGASKRELPDKVNQKNWLQFEPPHGEQTSADAPVPSGSPVVQQGPSSAPTRTAQPQSNARSESTDGNQRDRKSDGGGNEMPHAIEKPGSSSPVAGQSRNARMQLDPARNEQKLPDARFPSGGPILQQGRSSGSTHTTQPQPHAPPEGTDRGQQDRKPEIGGNEMRPAVETVRPPSPVTGRTAAPPHPQGAVASDLPTISSTMAVKTWGGTTARVEREDPGSHSRASHLQGPATTSSAAMPGSVVKSLANSERAEEPARTRSHPSPGFSVEPVKTRDETVARIERVLLASGPQMAAQELHAALRPLSPAAASGFLDASRELVATIFEQACKGLGPVSAKIGEKQADILPALALAHISAAIDKDTRSPRATRLQQDIGGIMLASKTSNDSAIFTGLALAIGIGAGGKLALMIASELAEHDDDPSRARPLMALMVAAFARLGERIEEAHGATLHHLGPLLVDWAAWRGKPDKEAIGALLAFLARRPGFLAEIQPHLDRVEHVGLEALRAIRDLAPPYLSADLCRMHKRFVTSEGVLGSIAASRTALREIRQMAAATGEAESKPSLEAAKIVLTHIGFDAPRSAFLAGISQIGHGSMLGRGWTLLEDFVGMEARGRAFQSLLAFLNGQYHVAPNPIVIGFGDLEMPVQPDD